MIKRIRFNDVLVTAKLELVNNILFIQDSSPCIRTIKIASALKSKGLNILLAHLNKTPDEAYGYGNSSFTSLTKLPKYDLKKIKLIKEIIINNNISILHYHNEPDVLCAKLIKSDLNIPIIYDQHDFSSIKKNISYKHLIYERICNENNDGAVYITENYRQLVSQRYKINPNNIVFPNYGLDYLLIDKEDILPKLSDADKKIHLVYVGLITEHKYKVRNMLNIFERLSKTGFVIHIYPTRNKEYKQYRKIENVIIHKQLPIQRLLKDISQYNFGIAFLNNKISDIKKVNEIKYGFWNKMYDYLMAGIPVLTSDFYVDMSNFIKMNGFGVSVESIENITPNLLKKFPIEKFDENIVYKREKYTMENQIDRLISFYHQTIKCFKEKDAKA
ncbi:MAG: glycosyltransferase [Candidatus Cloacimonetes bacterium]|nr:glycosyltransferase [Candidatus Cloacimonadota bacterium]